MKIRIAVTTLFLLAAIATMAAFSAPVRAAESYDACAGTLSTLPAVITTQGIWCLKGDLATGMASGSAIDVQVNNVTIDCNGFKLGGLGAGVTTQTTGIRGSGVSNLTVRNCSIRGFQRGVHAFVGGSGHRIEDNRFDANTLNAINVVGDGSVIRRNTVFDTGGSTGFGNTISAINATYEVDILDNTVRGVAGNPAISGFAIGIVLSSGPGGVVAGNRVGGVMRSAGGTEYLVYIGAPYGIVRDNALTRTQTGAVAIYCVQDTATAFSNTTNGPGTVLSTCHNAGHNTSPP